VASIRVTRLGDFSPIERFFAYWAIFRLLGDFLPIGRFFAFWAIVYFEHFLEKFRSIQNNWDTFFPRRK
jgi:hypothetical protein